MEEEKNIRLYDVDDVDDVDDVANLLPCPHEELGRCNPHKALATHQPFIDFLYHTKIFFLNTDDTSHALDPSILLVSLITTQCLLCLFFLRTVEDEIR